VARYLEIFKRIFERYDQAAHYNMLMGINLGAGQEPIEKDKSDE
jgi:hypothetical protein